MSNNKHPNTPQSKLATSPIAKGGALDMIRVNALKSIRDLTQDNVGTEIDSSERQDVVIQMATAMSQLSYQDYLTLDGILKDLVKRTHRHNFTTLANQDPNDTLNTIFLALNRLSDIPNYVNEATLLLRRCYPFGTNIVNKYWDESEGPFGFDASQLGVITATRKTDITFSPGEDESTCIIKAEGNTYSLKEGEPFIIGRPLINNRPFGTKIDASIPIQLPIKNDGYFSRSGLMLLLKEGVLYIFDKGSRNPITASQSRLTVNYDTQRSADGSYGHSNTERNETERPVDELF